LAPRGDFANALQEEVDKVKASREWRREYMTLEIFLEDAKREERKLGREEGEDKLLIHQVCQKLSRGMETEEIAQHLEKEEEEIQQIVDVAKEYAPQYDEELIYNRLHVG
jgi:hypothetical protein